MLKDTSTLQSELYQLLALGKFGDYYATIASLENHQRERKAEWEEAKEAIEPHLKGKITELAAKIRPYESAELLFYRKDTHRSKTSPLLRKAINAVNALVVQRAVVKMRPEDKAYLDSLRFDGMRFDEWINTNLYNARVKDPNALVGFTQKPMLDINQKAVLDLAIYPSKHILYKSSDFIIVKHQLSEREQGFDPYGNPRATKLKKDAYLFFGKFINALFVQKDGDNVDMLDYAQLHNLGMLTVATLGGEIDKGGYKSDFDFAVPQMDELDTTANAAMTATANAGTVIFAHKEMVCSKCEGRGGTPAFDEHKQPLRKQLSEGVFVDAFVDCDRCNGSGFIDPRATSIIQIPIRKNVGGADMDAGVTNLINSLLGFVQAPTENAAFLSEQTEIKYKQVQDLLNISAQNMNFAQSAESRQEARKEKEEILRRISNGVKEVMHHLLAVVVGYNTVMTPTVMETALKELAVIMPNSFIELDSQELELSLTQNLPTLSIEQRDQIGRKVMKAKNPSQQDLVDIYYNLSAEISKGLWLQTPDEIQTLDALGVLPMRDKIAALRAAPLLYNLLFQQQLQPEVAKAATNAMIDELVKSQQADLLPPLQNDNAI